MTNAPTLLRAARDAAAERVEALRSADAEELDVRGRFPRLEQLGAQVLVLVVG